MKKRGEKGYRIAAKEIEGISFSSLSKIENGRIPKLENYVRICKWLGVSTETFLTNFEQSTELINQVRLEEFIKSYKRLNPSTSEFLIKIINLAYQEG